MVITQQPESLSFAGNLKDFVITSQADIHFTLNLDMDIIVDEIYTPADGEVRIRLKDVVSRYLSVTLPAYTETEHEQVNAVKVFRAAVGDTSVSFTVVKGGIDCPGSIPDFLKYNFLTWQPQEKRICCRQPEFLSYYAQGKCDLKIKAYFENGDSATYTSPVPAGKLLCFNLNYDIVNSFFDNEAGCAYYDVWVEDASGNRFTYVQRYIPVPEPDHAEIYVFENTLGGVDSFLCTGKLTEKISTEGVIATRYEETADDSVDLKVCYEQNTGYLRSRGEAEWLRDFFVSPQRYHVAPEGLRKIYIEEQENKYTESDVNNYSFEYYYCKQTLYNKVVRNRDDLPRLLEFPSAEGLFFLTPRLTEYPAASYSDELLFPVQHPYTGEWLSLPASLFKPSGGGGAAVELIDNLTSVRTDAGLTANMGRYLKSLIEGKASDWNSITGKPETFPASAHVHSAGDINSGVFDIARIPDVPVSKVTSLQSALDLKLDKSVWDRYFYEKDGNVYCRLDFVGEKGVSAYGSGPDGSSGGGWDLIDNLTSTRTDAGLTANMGRYLKSLIDGKASDWNSITGRPETFPTAPHTHSWADITGKPSEFPVGWDSITGKPGAFPAAAHTHSWSDITGKPAFDSVYVKKTGDVMSGGLTVQNLSFPAVPEFDVNAPARSTLNPMSLKLFDSYGKSIGLSAGHATILEIYGRSGHWDNQVAFDGFNGSVYYRNATWNSPSFCAWRKFWDSNNHGPGSGLNADMLDGYHRNNLYQGIDSWMSNTAGLNATIDLSSPSYDVNTFYPVTGSPIPKLGMHFIKVAVQLDSGTKPSWSKHASGFTCNMELWATSAGWGTTEAFTLATQYSYRFADKNPCGYSQLGNASVPIIWLRGGGKYYVRTGYFCSWTIRTASTVLSDQTVAPQPGGNAPFSFTKSTIYANLNGTLTGNAFSATRLQAARTLWGQSFDGTNNISGNISGVGSLTSSDSTYLLSPSASNPYLRLLAGEVSYFCQASSSGISIGVSGLKGLTVNSAGRGSFSDGLSVGYNNRAYKLSVSDFICNDWVRTLGSSGWFNETYSGGIYMADNIYIRVYNNKRFYVSNAEYASFLTDGGFTRQGYSGTSWYNGHGALNVAITNNSAQTPLIVAYRAGQTPAVIGANRLFSMELLNTGTTIHWAFGGAKKFEFTSAGNFLAAGEVTAYSASDIRLKTNIRPLDGLSYIGKLRPVEFDWNSQARVLCEDNRRHGYGLIAQEVENVLPAVVGNIYNSEYLGIQYEKLIPILIAAVKQLSDEVNQLKRTA